MHGQWIGQINGTNQGVVIVNSEKRNGELTGTITVLDSHENIPHIIANVKLTLDHDNMKAECLNISPIHPMDFQVDTWENVESYYPGIHFPSKLNITGKVDTGICTLDWKTDVNTVGTARLFKSKADQPSEYPSEKKTWKEFKEFISSLRIDDFIFRGQRRQRRLRTLFHRCGRCDLFRYRDIDVPILTRYINSASSYFFKSEDARDYGALLGLAQHHGYPTPLLDWTASPYVAAYFAYENSSKADSKEYVRVFAFDSTKWAKNFHAIDIITTPFLTLKVYELYAINNSRMIPQQSVTTFSNVDDIENFIQTYEAMNNEKYLYIIDLPVSERLDVMKELSHMGIAAGSLFPGFDGICKGLREKYF